VLEDMAWWLRWVPGKWFREFKNLLPMAAMGPRKFTIP
jgi:hypothetical protein